MTKDNPEANLLKSAYEQHQTIVQRLKKEGIVASDTQYYISRTGQLVFFDYGGYRIYPGDMNRETQDLFFELMQITDAEEQEKVRQELLNVTQENSWF